MHRCTHRSKTWIVVAATFLMCVAVAACSAGGGAALQGLVPPPTTPPSQPPPSFVYYSTGNDSQGPNPAGIGAVAYPITASSSLAFTLNLTALAGMNFPNMMAKDSFGRLFVINYTNFGLFYIDVLNLPLSATSSASFLLYMPNTIPEVRSIAFDAGGNLWVGTGDNQLVQFKGPFSATTTLVPSLSIRNPEAWVKSIAFDRAGNMYVALYTFGATQHTTAVYLKGSGFSNQSVVDHYLDGVPDAVSALFDKAGNFYTAGSGGVAMYNSNNLGSGATPNVVDRSGPDGYNPEQAVFDPNGNLYLANCRNVYVFPTGSQPLSPTLMPVTYTDVNTRTANCVYGVAIY